MALFENCSEEKIDQFLANVAKLINERNSEPGSAVLSFSTGIAVSREDRDLSINQLIALADRRCMSGSREDHDGKA